METGLRISGQTATVQAPAKINLYIEILEKRPDGYHEIVTVMQTVSLFDSITVTRRRGDIELACTDENIPQDKDNLAWQAAEKTLDLLDTRDRVKIEIEKRIPVGRGLGGGSSDAAAVILAINELWERPLGPEKLHEIAARLGSDVPFFLEGGAALCRGRGEQISPIRSALDAYFIVVSPEIAVPTRKVYEEGNFGQRPLNLLTEAEEHGNSISAGLQRGDFFAVANALYNGFTQTVFDLFPRLSSICHRLGQHLGAVTLTGTGSALFCMCRTMSDAHACAGRIDGSLGNVYVAGSLPGRGRGG